MYAVPGILSKPWLTKAQLLLGNDLDTFTNRVGLRNVGFLTLRFYPKLYNKAKASRKLKRFCDKVLAQHFGDWIRVWQRHKDSSWHVHILIDCRVDIASDYDSDYDTIGKANPNENLRRLRQVLHRNTVKFGFGRFYRRDLEPAKGRDSMLTYLVNKLSRRERRLAGKGMRMVQYSPGFSRPFNSRSKAMLLTPVNRKMRRFAGLVASRLGCEDEDALAEALGDWSCLLWMYVKEFRQLTGTYILNRLDEYRPRWRPSDEVVGEDGQKHEVVHQVDEYFASIEEHHGYLPPRRRRRDHSPASVNKRV